MIVAQIGQGTLVEVGVTMAALKSWWRGTTGGCEGGRGRESRRLHCFTHLGEVVGSIGSGEGFFCERECHDSHTATRRESRDER